MKKRAMIALLSAAAITAVHGADKVVYSPKITKSVVSYSAKVPEIDGVISKSEYYGAFENYGLLTYNTPFLSTRQGKCFAANDGTYLYLAMQSEVPDADSNVKLLKRFKKRDGAVMWDDNVEFLVTPPDGNAVYHMIINPADTVYDVKYPMENGGISFQKFVDWDPELKVKSVVDGKYWTVELRVPLKDLGYRTGTADETWHLQFARSWQNPVEQCSYNVAAVFAEPGNMNPVLFTKKTPSAAFTGMGAYEKGENNISFRLDNNTGKPVTYKYRVHVNSDAAARTMDNEITVPAGGSKEIALKYTEKSKLSYMMDILFRDAATGKILLQRSLNWNYPRGTRWVAPDHKTGATLEIGVYPYYNLIRARLGNHGIPYDVRKVRSATVRITDSNGKTVGKEYTPEQTGMNGFYRELELPKLAKGEYFVEMRLKKTDGKEEVFKEKFYFNNFAWEHNKIGMDRIVIPPYKDLVYGKNTVKTLKAEYTLANGFFSRVAAGKAENLLASPIVMTVNGKELKGDHLVWKEQAKDLCVTEQNLQIPGVSFTVNNTIEFDNFVKTVVTVKPEKEFKFDSMTLEIPLKTEIVKRIHSTCNSMKHNPTYSLPVNEGEVWNSKAPKLNVAVSNNFRPYTWLGDLAEGFAFFTESDKNWSRDPEKSMLQLIRKGDTSVLRVNFVDKPTIRKDEFTLTFGFQATPTRDRPNSVRQLLERNRGPNSLPMAVLAGGAAWSSRDYDFFPLNHDYYFIRELIKFNKGINTREKEKEVVETFMKNNAMHLPETRRKSFGNGLRHGIHYAITNKYLAPYINARASHLRWEDYLVYMDEWFCSDFRANNEDDYNNSPSKSYQDFLLYQQQILLREGLHGIYHDNIRDWHNTNTVTGPAYVMDGGKIQPYFDIFDMRQLIKRTAVLIHQEGASIFDGRPLYELHMTNTNLVPFTSLGSITLDLEDKFGSMDFQDRFTEDWLKACTIGLQTGSIPKVLIGITGKNPEFVTRTFLSVMLAYDIPAMQNCGGVAQVWYKTWNALKAWGYGTDDVEVFPCYSPSGRVQADSKDIRLTEYRKKDGTTIVAVSSFGHTGKGTVKFKDRIAQAVNFETGAPLTVKDNAVGFELQKNDFMLIKVQ